MDLYFQNMKEHRVCPRSPFELYPPVMTVSGEHWEGGELVSDLVHGGRRALKVVDAETDRNVEARATDKITVDPSVPYELALFARADADNQPYTVLVEAFNAEGQWLASQNILRVFQAGKEWKAEKVEIKGLSPEVSTLTLRLFPAFRNAKGDTTGTVTFDDIVLAAAPSSPGQRAANLLRDGDFEMSIDDLGVRTDFTEFDRAARRYLDELGFNSFDLGLQGLGSGSFFSHEEGMLAGFRQGTPEYDRLLSQYLGQVQDHLEKNGWLGREYIYWFDEPDEKDYPFVRAGMTNIRRNASRLTRFITEHKPGPGIMDVSEIGCTIFHRVDPKIVAELAPQGREFWSYLCTGPKSPWVTLFIDHPAINLRMWLWMSFKFGLKGILVWESDYWNGYSLVPPGLLQNPWDDPMSYSSGYGEPFGQVNDWGNGDGRFLYPPNRDPNRDKTKYLCGPVNSVRWEVLREGIEDYEYLVLLRDAAKKAGPEKKALADKAEKLLDIPEFIFKSGQDYTKDPKVLLEYRRKVAALIEALTAQGR
jgi:hypothetical protein